MRFINQLITGGGHIVGIFKDAQKMPPRTSASSVASSLLLKRLSSMVVVLSRSVSSPHWARFFRCEQEMW